MATLAIDFDGTLHDWEHPSPGHRLGPPMGGAVQAMRTLQDQGHKLVIFTVRANGWQAIRAVEDWLNFFKIPYDSVTNVKSGAFDLFIDDRGYRFESWDQVLDDLPQVL